MLSGKRLLVTGALPNQSMPSRWPARTEHGADVVLTGPRPAVAGPADRQAVAERR